MNTENCVKTDKKKRYKQDIMLGVGGFQSVRSGGSNGVRNTALCREEDETVHMNFKSFIPCIGSD